jgi:hypothetical protein
MDDGRDAYLSRCLKNWASQQHPSEQSRLRLLKTAAGPSLPDREQRFAVLKRFFSPNSDYRYPQDNFRMPMTQSHLWSLHLALDLRQIT